MIDFKSALNLILSGSPPLSAKEKLITEAMGRVIAAKVTAPINFPPYTKATVDGFAFFSEDAKDKKAIHEVIGSITAGTFPSEKLERGQAMQIQAESPMPNGSDTVVPMDEVRLLMNGTRVGMLKRIRKGKNIVPAGEQLKKDEDILRAGKCLTAVDLCLLSLVGINKVSVFPPARVGVLAFGNEFISVGKKRKRGQIWDSNSIQLLTSLYEMRTQPEYFGIVAENEEKINRTLSRAKSCNVLIITGMSGVKRHNLLMNVFKRAGIEVLFDGIFIEPSGSVMLAKNDKTLIFILPEDSFFTMILFEVLIVPALRRMMGHEQLYHSVMDAILEKRIRKSKEYCLIQPGYISFQKNRCYFNPCDFLQKMDIYSYAKCNGLIRVTKGGKSIKSGKSVEVILTKQVCD